MTSPCSWGKNSYSELDILAFQPEKNEILVRTKDKERNLFLFNYRSLLYKKLGNGVIAARATPDMIGRLHARRKGTSIFTSANPISTIIQLSPYSRKKINSRRDLNAIIDCSDPERVYFSTYNGELLKLDDAGNFSNPQVSLTGALHQPSPDLSKVARFHQRPLLRSELVRVSGARAASGAKRGRNVSQRAAILKRSSIFAG